MRAIVCRKPGELVYRELPMPLASEGYTLVRIRRIGICGTDLHAYEGTQPYFTYPRILGHELAAEIVETDVNDFSKGERVTILPYFACAQCFACRSGKPNCCSQLNVCGVHVDGGMVDYFSVPTASLIHGDGLSYDALALVEPLAIAAHAVRRAGVVPGEFVLVAGAGPIGLGIMEFARIAGAKVIAMDVNAERLQFCEEKLSVPYTINPLNGAVTQTLQEITNGDMPGLVIDATGNLGAINQAFGFLSHGGRYILVGLQKGDIAVSHPEFHKREATLMSSRNATRSDFEEVMKHIQDGNLDPAAFITHRVPFCELVQQFSSFLNPASAVIKAVISID